MEKLSFIEKMIVLVMRLPIRCQGVLSLWAHSLPAPQGGSHSLGRFISVMKFSPLESWITQPTCWWIGEWCHRANCMGTCNDDSGHMLVT